ncbi:MAG: TolC family protein [Thermoanaerobaculales bacterium]
MNLRRLITVSLILASTPLTAIAQATGAGGPEPAASAEPTGELSLERAVSTALSLSPVLAAVALGVPAAEARLDQAAIYANPNLGIEVENFGGSGERDGFNVTETTFALSQPLLLGGKIAGRKGIARADLALATRDLEAVRLDIAAMTTIAFNNVIVAQERVRLTEELAELAQSFGETVRARVEAGKVSPVEGIRARAAVARARVDVANAKRALAAVRVSLATTWGSSDPQFSRAVGRLPRPSPPPPRAMLDEWLQQTPEMARLTEELQRQEQVIKLEKARGVPDLTLALGSRNFQDTGDWAWVGGMSLPLPIFNRNQGARRAAEFELERTRREVAAVRIALESRLSRILEGLRAAEDEARSYEREIVPASTEAFEAMSLGFREGKFGFLEVLDAQRSLFEATLLLLDSRQRYAATRTQLERLVGRPPHVIESTGFFAGDAPQGENQ